MNEGLLTSKAVSEAVTGGQIVTSIVMFAVIYLLLLAIWVVVLNHKIHQGPEPAIILSRTSGAKLAGVAGERVGHEESLSEAKTTEDSR